MKKNKQAGFSIIEIVIVLGIVAVARVIATLSLVNKKSSVNLNNVMQQIAATLREAQSKSVANDSGVVWGVHFDNPANNSAFYALFKSSYVPANTLASYPLPSGVIYASSSVTSGGSVDVTFTQYSGLPSASTTLITLQ